MIRLASRDWWTELVGAAFYRHERDRGRTIEPDSEPAQERWETCLGCDALGRRVSAQDPAYHVWACADCKCVMGVSLPPAEISNPLDPDPCADALPACKTLCARFACPRKKFAALTIGGEPASGV